MSLRTKVIIALALLVAIIVVYNFTPVGDMIDLQRLLEEKDALLERVQQSFLLASLIFILAYIAVVGLSIPGATVLTLLGGFLFGPWIGTILVNIGATTGAVLIFLVARYFLGKDVQEKYKEKLGQLNKEIESNGKSYFLTLRLIPVFPFFLINLLAGFTTIPLWTFLWTTALGIIPGSFVYAYLGSTGANAGATGNFAVQVTIALVLLGVLSLVPMIIKKIKGKRNEQNKS